MTDLRAILLAEDHPKDVELTLEALTEHLPANHVTVHEDVVDEMEFHRLH